MACAFKCPWSEDIAIDKVNGDSKTKSLPAVSSCSVLRNNAPRWHDHLQCWCLNFHGRVTVASVKNFQLVATLDQSQPGGIGDEETVLLHENPKVGENIQKWRTPGISHSTRMQTTPSAFRKAKGRNTFQNSFEN